MGGAETLVMPVVFGLANALAPTELRGRYNGALWAAVGAAFLLACAAAAALVAVPLGRAVPEALEAAACSETREHGARYPWRACPLSSAGRAPPW